MRGHVVTPEAVVVGEVVCEAGRIIEIRPDDTAAHGPDAGRWVSAGFIDLQINGSDGIDLAVEPERVGELAALLTAEGVTAFCPTIVTCADDTRDAAISRITAHRTRSAATTQVNGAAVLGVHLEGPLLSSRRRGAHPEAHLAHVVSCPTSSWSPDHGVVFVTLAPELHGALELIAELTSAGVVVALGHTDATAEQFQAGLDAGATHVTHLFNAMRPFGHRDPGPIGVIFADDTVTAGLICDGVHVDPLAVQMAWRSLGPDRIDLVTDAVAARGASPVADGIRTPDGVLAGSDLTLDRGLRNLVAATGAGVLDALRTVTSTPSRVLGLVDRGAIVPGHRADLTVLDADLRVIETYLGGVATGVAGRSPRQ